VLAFRIDAPTRIEGVTLILHGNTMFGIEVADSLVLDDAEVTGASDAVYLPPDQGASLTATNTTFDGNTFMAIDASDATDSTVTLNNSDVTNNGNGITAGGALNLNNTIIALNGKPPNHYGCAATGSGGTVLASLSDDHSCGTTESATLDAYLGPLAFNGGPTKTRALSSDSPAIGAGDDSVCPTTDQRFFVRGDGHCDVGAYEAGAAQDTTAPSCAVTATRHDTDPQQQDVTARDLGSGLGPDAITNVAIDNGTVAAPTIASPTTAGQVVTATKSDQSVLTHWSFDVTDWSGNTKHCG
jgi:hypothetical protein